MSRDTLASGAAPNDAGNLRAWIADPSIIKPGSKMPAMGLSGSQVNAVAQYLETLR
jgi:cytochrome c oxidase subunit 2